MMITANIILIITSFVLTAEIFSNRGAQLFDHLCACTVTLSGGDS